MPLLLFLFTVVPLFCLNNEHSKEIYTYLKFANIDNH